MATQYSGTEETSHGLTGIAATYVIGAEGVVRDEQVADNPGDRTYGNYVRYSPVTTTPTGSRERKHGRGVLPLQSRLPI
nr:hypothetical protein [Haloplanus ruber]